MQRKIHAAIATLGIGLTGTAFAQSSVTLYGIVDQSIRFTNNSNAANDNQVQLTNGAITNSRWGLKGQEDLGGDLADGSKGPAPCGFPARVVFLQQGNLP